MITRDVGQATYDRARAAARLMRADWHDRPATIDRTALPHPEQTAWECLIEGADVITLDEAQDVFDTMLLYCGVEREPQP